MRSTKPPITSAGVIAAKVIWKQTNAYSGIAMPLVNVSEVVSVVTPDRNILDRPPMKALPEVKARL